MSDSIEHGYNCEVLALSSYDEMRFHRESVLNTKIAFLDVNLGRGQWSGIDTYEWLRSHEFQGQIFFLTGHAGGHPLVAKAMECGHAAVLHKPVPTELLMQDVRDAI